MNRGDGEIVIKQLTDLSAACWAQVREQEETNRLLRVIAAGVGRAAEAAAIQTAAERTE